MNTEIDSFLDRSKVREITTLSFPTINRMQRAGKFPKFEKISAGRVGLRQSVLAEFLAGRRDWDKQSAST